MPSSKSLSRLMKWLRRDPWKDAFADVLDRHLGRACSKAGIEIGELGNIIGDDWSATLWGCAFEDFLTRDLGESGNIVEDYLKRRGWNESALNKAYITGLRSSVMSLYEVSEIKAGESFLARDLFRGGEPVRISERSATQSLKPWDRIAARVVELRGKNVIGGGLLPFDHELSESLLTSLHRAQEQAAKEGAEVLPDIDHGIGTAEIDAAFSNGELLCLAAPLISTIWLDDLLTNVLNPVVPELRNSEGEEMEFFSLHYKLLPGVTAAVVREALDRLPDLRAESPTFWNWLAPEGGPVESSKSEVQTGLSFMSTMEDGSVVLGSLELKNKTLLVSVTSESRAGRARAMLTPVLEELVGTPLVERQTIAQAMADRSVAEADAASTCLPRKEERRIVHAGLEAHYRKQLEEPIPALGDITPRQAAKTAEGREKLVAWLKRLENSLTKHDPSDPMADYDVTWLWNELGVADLRK